MNVDPNRSINTKDNSILRSAAPWRSRRSTSLWVAAPLVCALAAGCTVGPNYQRPELPLPPAFVHAEHPPASAATTDLAEWWSKLNDKVLLDLERRVTEENIEIARAEARVREARARRAALAGREFPSIDAFGGYSRTRISENGLPFGGAGSPTPLGSTLEPMTRAADSPGNSPGQSSSTGAFGLLPEFDLFQLGFDASWEIDVFGGVRREKELLTAQLQGAEERRRQILVTATAEAAREYVLLRTAQQELQLAHSNVKTAQETVSLTKSELLQGVGTEFDVRRAEVTLKTLQSRIPLLLRDEALTRQRLALLLGTTADTLPSELSEPGEIPTLDMPATIGIPADLLRRRPDVREAEQGLIAATAAVGVAESDLYPKLRLGGSFSFASAHTGSLFDSSSRGFSVGPSLLVPLFHAGALREIVNVRKEQVEQALATYRLSVVSAVRDVQDALATIQTERERNAALVEAVQARRDVFQMAKSLYSAGLSDFLAVLDAEQALFIQEEELTRSSAVIVTATIALYKALGGGWDETGAGAGGESTQ